MIHTSTLTTSKTKKTNKEASTSAVCFDDYCPNNSVIQTILNYSKSLTVKKSQYVEFIEVVNS